MSLKTKTKNKTKTVTLRLPVDLLDFIEKDAEERRRTKSNYIEWLVYRQMKNQIEKEKMYAKELDNLADEYYLGNSKTKTISTEKDLDEYLENLNKEG